MPIVRWRDPTARPRGADRATGRARGIRGRASSAANPHALEVIRPSLEDIYLELVRTAEADTRDDEEALA